MDRALSIFGLLIGLAGAAISLIGLSDETLKAYPLIAQYRPTILVVSLAIAAVSALILILASLTQARDALLTVWEMAQGRPPGRLATMRLTEISEGQLDLAYSYIKTVMEAEGVSQVMTFEQFRSMWQTDHFIYGLLWDHGDPASLRIVGFLSIFPLNKPAAELVLSCRLRGSQLRAEHLAGDNEDAAAYFVGAIAASSWKARAEVVRVLDGAIAKLKLQRQNPLLLTSPFTTRGRSLARQFGFRRLRDYPGYGELWSQNQPLRLEAAPGPTRLHKILKRASSGSPPSPA
ncbi:MAG: hypothetical protein P4M07_04485 [Xanthobacteraceae bacterium]|nr:hypothetical protein [Xanthobacteraceae bacterium]